MKKFRLIDCCTTFLATIVLLFPLHVQATDRNDSYISSTEFHEMLENSDMKYIYLGKEFSDLYEVVSRIGKLEDNEDSLLNELQRHIEDGFSVGLYESVLEALNYAEKALQDNSAKISPEEAQDISQSLEIVMNQVINDALNISAKKITHTPSKMHAPHHPVTPSKFSPGKDHRVFRTKRSGDKVHFNTGVDIHGKLKVYGPAIFRDNVEFEEDVCFEDEVKFKDKVKFEHFVKFDGNVKFEEDVTIEETLTVTDLVVLSCIDNLCVTSLTVIDIIVPGGSCLDHLCVNNLSVTDLVVLSCMDNLCVNNLSVTDLTVTSCIDFLCVNTLSVTDIITGCFTNLCVENLSVVNGIIDNLTVTNCMTSLCVDTLSVTDLIVPSLSTCDIIVGCDILMNNTAGAAIGNIFKGGNRFMHNAGTDNTFLGINAGNFTTTGAENVGIGRQALSSNTTGFENVAVGAFALPANTIGENDVAVGAFALAVNTTGNENTALGGFTLVNNTIGSGNTAVGFDAGFSLATGDNNVFVGNNAGNFATTGFTNVIIGNSAGASLIIGDDNIYISNAGMPAESGIIRIGTVATHTAAFIQGIFPSVVGGTGIPVFVDATGQLGTVVSSRRFKHDIADMTSDISQNIYKLRPVTFVYNSDESDTQQYGLVAEEVAEVLPALVVHDEEGVPYTVRYHILPMLLLNEVQKLNGIIEDQAITINELKSDNKKFGEIIETVIAKINDLNH